MPRRVVARVADETADKIAYWADRMGVSQSQLASICIQAGLGSVIRAISPEEAFTPEQLAKIIKAAEKEGIKFEGSSDEKKAE